MNWFRFYSDALDDPKVQRLPGDLFKTWVNLLCLANKGDERGVLPSVEDMAFALRIDVPTMQAAVDELTARELLDPTDAGPMPHNWHGRQKKSDNVTARVQEHRKQYQKDETLRETGTKQDVKRERNSLEKNREEKNREEERDTHVETAAAAAAVRAPQSLRDRALTGEHLRRFQAFWQAYPKKHAKQEAVRWWQRHKPDDPLLDQMLGAIARQLQSGDWQKEGGRFIPMPSTWLNQHRWEDEPAVLPRTMGAPRRVWD